MRSDEIDELYRRPLGEFTATRNALAKARGAAGAEIKTLEKPTLPAWAVNQVYWHDRAVWDALIRTSLEVRRAHVEVISGRTADVAGAERSHAEAMKAAVAAARTHCTEAGEKATPATIEAITDTFQALPSEDAPGRLVKPLKPLGFGALMQLGIEVQGPQGPQGPQGAQGPGSRVRERKAAEKALRAAESAEAKAEAALDEARKAAAAAERELERLRDKLVFVEKQRADAAELVRQRERELRDASNARVQAAQALAASAP